MTTKKTKLHLEEKVREAVRLLGSARVHAIADEPLAEGTHKNKTRKRGRQPKSFEWWVLAYQISRPFRGPVTDRKFARDLSENLIFDDKKLTADGFRDLRRQVKAKFDNDPTLKKAVLARIGELTKELSNSLANEVPLTSSLARSFAMIFALRAGRLSQRDQSLKSIIATWTPDRKEMH
ncbi:MAG: hypothetical protein HY059_11710 [Proteobacteria bacterium]|nr:hypothetical protein [Pseudomonadota bacterium]